MPIARPFYVRLLAAGLLIALCSHTPRAENKDADSGRIEESWRPDTEKLQKAEAALADLSDEQKTILNAMRVLANRPKDREATPPQQRMRLIPSLGASIASASRPMDSWLALRLAALLRAGYPVTPELLQDVSYFLASAPQAKETGMCGLLLEMCVADALISRKDGTLALCHPAAERRAKAALAQATWTTSTPQAAPTAAQLRDLGCEAICRHIVRTRGWASSPKGWSGALESLFKRFKGKVWTEAATDDENAAQRAAAWLTVIFSLAKEAPEIDAGKASLAKLYSSACGGLGRLLGEQTALRPQLISREGAAFLALCIEECEPAGLKPIARTVKTRALQTLEAGFSTKTRGVGIVEALGWTPPEVQAARPRLPEGVALPPTPPALMMPEPEALSQFALTLLGATGGLIGGEVKPVGTAEQFDGWATALATIYAHKEPKLEARVNIAIDRAVNWLKRQQKPDGTFPGEYNKRMGGHALSLLALLDGGVPREDPCIAKGMGALGKLQVGKPAAQLDGRIYCYSVTLLLLQKYYEHEQQTAKVMEADSPEEYRQSTAKVWRAIKGDHREMINKMLAALTKDDRGFGWSYFHPAAKDGVEVMDYSNNNWRDNSNSQYAVLGLKAASLLGANFDRSILANEARRLIKYYGPDTRAKAIEVDLPEDEKKRTSSAPKGSIVPGGWDYISATGNLPAGFSRMATVPMTAAGVSSLVICRDELMLHKKLDDKLRREIELHIHGALHWIGTHFSYRLETIGGARVFSGAEGWGKYYDMYSIERAGVLADARLMADVDWYAEGARLLVETQGEDGAWADILTPGFGGNQPRTVDHCFAILFLKRAAVPVHRKPVITEHKSHDKPANPKGAEPEKK